VTGQTVILRRYLLVWSTVALAGIVGLLLLTPLSWLAPWIAGGYALAVAARSGLSMLRSLRSGSWGLDVLAVAAIVSTVVLGDYWAALVVVLMLTSGEALEDFAARRARSEVSALLERAPRVAHVERDGEVADVDVDDVVAGDRLAVRPGEVIPVDGVLLTAASLDEASVTGESLPVWRAAGSSVMSGAVTTDTVVAMRATATAADSEYQAIIDLVRAAADSKAPFVRLADRVAIPFTVGAFVLGVSAWLISGDPARLAEVLVVATPCPLLIATPVAFIAGMSRAAARGVIIKGGAALEQLARIRSAAFDKTGTITRGVPIVVRVEALLDDVGGVLGVAAALEASSAHVLARAVVDEAAQRSVVVPHATEISEQVAQGVSGIVDGVPVRAGKLAFVAAEAHPEWSALAAGETAVHVSRDGRLMGRIVLADAVRDESATTIARLKELGVDHLVMLTGDAVDTAVQVGSLVGLDDVRAGLLPADKVAAVRELAPRPAMMVGDGVNDAPVLASADVGVAMGARGATAASESADVVVLVDDLGRVLDALLIARRTIRIAYQSIGIGIGLSVLLMVTASFGVLPAIVGAALQEVVDVIAILNGLRAGRPLRAGSAARAARR